MYTYKFKHIKFMCIIYIYTEDYFKFYINICGINK